MKVDKNIVYSLDNYVFESFLNLTEESKKMVHTWRNDTRIRRWMYNPQEIGYNAHLLFLDNLRLKDDKFYWLVYFKEVPVGVLSLINVDYLNNSAEIGFYYRPDKPNHSIFGIDYVHTMYSFAFHSLHLDLIKGGIWENNIDSLSISLFLGAYIVGETVLELGGIY